MGVRFSPGIALALSLLLGIAACGLFVLVGRGIGERCWKDAEATLRSQVLILEDGLAGELESADPTVLQARMQRLGATTGIRITLIRPDGSVLADSEANPAAMDNLGTRTEVLAALQEEFGCIRRHSPTLGVESLFVAKAVRHGEVLAGWIRASVTAADIDAGIGAIGWSLAIAIGLLAAGALALGVFAALLRSRRARSPAR